MTNPRLDETLIQENASQAWDLLSQKVEALVAYWDQHGQPPPLDDFLPERPAALRRMVLIELVKVDLEYRWQQTAHRCPLEHYLERYAELAPGGKIPCDLIYEEFHIRGQAGDALSPDDYFRRFPGQADELQRLLGADRAHVTTMLVPVDRADDIEPGQRLDDFDLMVRLGKGAFGTVFLARQVSMQRLVALKITSDRGNEPQTMAQLDHPHIVRVFDQRQLSGRPLRLLYMQYIAGGTLQGVVDRVRATPPELRRGALLFEAIDEELTSRGETPLHESYTRRELSQAAWGDAVCWLGSRLAAALEYAHQRGVLHRDVKPANVLLAADGSPKLADFNISFCDQVEGATPAAYFGGSLAYMSPEQLQANNPAHPRQADDLDGRSDVYSLGVMLWELLTGQRPFQDDPLAGGWAETLQAMVARREAGLSESALRQLPSDCPPGLVPVLQTTLEADRDRRWSSAGALGRQLDLCLQPQAQQLLRPRSQGWAPWLRRHPLAALFLAALPANIVFSVWNITYNYAITLRELFTTVPDAREIFLLQILLVNPVLYGGAVAILLWLIMPVIRAVARRQLGHTLETAQVQSARQRSLWIGDFVAWTSVAMWSLSGVIFPAGMHWHLTSAAAGARPVFDFRWLYGQFILSQVLSSLFAAVLAYFLVALLAARVYYPVLIDPEAADSDGVDRVRRFVARSRWSFALVIGAAIVSLFVGGMMQVDGVYLFGIFVLGTASLALCWRIMASITRDAEALALIADPSLAPRAATHSSDSFWSSSR